MTALEWNRLCKNISISDQVKVDWWSIIERRYNEEWRSYHTLSHLNHLLQLFNQWRERIANLDSVLLAIFFHDIVYDPMAKDNELQSVVLFKKFALDGQLSKEMTSRVSEMIMATISHSPTEDTDDLDLCLFLDFDMAILGEDKPIYDAYAANIRREYSHYDDKAYTEGRSKVLQSFLKSDRIYYSEDLQEVFERKARENIEREIQNLRSSIL